MDPQISILFSLGICCLFGPFIWRYVQKKRRIKENLRNYDLIISKSGLAGPEADKPGPLGGMGPGNSAFMEVQL